MTKINMAYFLDCTENEGPGKRSAIWVQGCHFDCPECCNLELQAFQENDIVNINDIMDMLKKAVKAYEIEGVTLLGGEPMLQAKGLSVLAHACQKIGLSVMIFTGFTLDLLRKKPIQGSTELLEYTDVLVDGLYMKNLPENLRNWCGSTNQRFHYLSTRYDSTIETDVRYSPTIEIAVSPDSLGVSGFPL